jgi:hypothetical protein
MTLMRKRTLHRNRVFEEASRMGQEWLDLQRVAQVEITSEAETHPIESALIPGIGPGWRAAEPGEQTIRLIFDEPQTLRRILLTFDEEGQARTQEFVLSWFSEDGKSSGDILRQQYHFSPPGTTREVEDYHVELNHVAALELRIVPDIGGGNACASLAQLCLA